MQNALEKKKENSNFFLFFWLDEKNDEKFHRNGMDTKSKKIKRFEQSKLKMSLKIGMLFLCTRFGNLKTVSFITSHHSFCSTYDYKPTCKCFLLKRSNSSNLQSSRLRKFLCYGIYEFCFVHVFIYILLLNKFTVPF